MLLRFLAALAVLSAMVSAYAAPRDAVPGYQQAVSAQMQDLVMHTLTQFFNRVGQQQPERIEVSTNADFDLSKIDPTIRQVALDVTLTSDLPAGVIREARAELVHTFQGNGYRTEVNKPGAAPLLLLNIDVQPITHPDEHNGTREYAILAALIGGALAAVILAINLLSRGLRPAKTRSRPSKASPARDEPSRAEPAHYWPGDDLVASSRRRSEPSVGLPPLPAPMPRPQANAGLPPLRLDQTSRDR